MKKIIPDIAAFLLIVLLVYTAASKLMGQQQFRYGLSQMSLIKEHYTIVAIGVPIIELGIATLLIIPGTKKIGFIIAGILLSVFTVYLFWMTATQKQLPCSCGGALRYLNWQEHIVFNILFIALSATGFFLTQRSIKSKALLQ